MADLIERAAVLDKLTKKAHEWRGSFTGDAYSNAAQMMKKPPAVDAVEVVRCRDCKHWGGVVFGFRCKKWSSYPHTFNQTLEDDFCSRGERRCEDG